MQNLLSKDQNVDVSLQIEGCLSGRCAGGGFGMFIPTSDMHVSMFHQHDFQFRK